MDLRVLSRFFREYYTLSYSVVTRRSAGDVKTLDSFSRIKMIRCRDKGLLTRSRARRRAGHRGRSYDACKFKGFAGFFYSLILSYLSFSLRRSLWCCSLVTFIHCDCRYHKFAHAMFYRRGSHLSRRVSARNFAALHCEWNI